jgi:hypothetical protein
LAHGIRKVLLIEATTKQRGPCQVRSKTEHPCLHQAVVEIQGIPFCEGCAREQEAYFAIGTLSHEEAEGLHNGPLAKAPRFARRGRSWPKKSTSKSTSAESRFTREDTASARPSSKEEYERILEWWENYDPGMDADLLSRARSNSLRPLLCPRSL